MIAATTLLSLATTNATVRQEDKVNVTIIEWQGCPDCTRYGDGLVAQGLKLGLGTIMDLTVHFRSGSHPGIDSDPALQPWVACEHGWTPTLDPYSAQAFH